MTPAYDGPPNAEVLLVGEAWGHHEENWKPSPKPFVGPSGQLLNQLCVAAGYDRSRCRVTNVVHARPPGNKIETWLTDSPKKAKTRGLTIEWRGMWMNEIVREGIDELAREIARLHPKVIVAFGNTPLWALTGEQGITKWRGSELWYETEEGRTDIPVIPVLHPAYILRTWKEKPITIHDLRVRAFGKLSRPEARQEPLWRFRTRPESWQQLGEWLAPLYDALQKGPTWVVSDVETRLVPYPRLTCIGFGWSVLDAVCVPFEYADGRPYWGEADPIVRNAVAELLTHPNIRIVGQNFNYDAQYIELDLGPRVYCAWDTGIAQHLMFPGMPKDLARLASLYCDHYVYWKDDLKEWAKDWDENRMWRYNCIDCVRTFEVFEKQRPALASLGLV